MAQSEAYHILIQGLASFYCKGSTRKHFLFSEPEDICLRCSLAFEVDIYMIAYIEHILLLQDVKYYRKINECLKSNTNTILLIKAIVPN